MPVFRVYSLKIEVMSGKLKEAISVLIILSLIALIQLCEQRDQINPACEVSLVAPVK